MSLRRNTQVGGSCNLRQDNSIIYFSPSGKKTTTNPKSGKIVSRGN